MRSGVLIWRLIQKFLICSERGESPHATVLPQSVCGSQVHRVVSFALIGNLSMWSRAFIFWTLFSAAWGAPSTKTLCPEDCECIEQQGLEAHCRSLSFLDKLHIVDADQIISLNLKSRSLKHINTKLHKLHNLKKLDLSDNGIDNLKHFPHLPKLTHLNLKKNFIKDLSVANLPKTLKHLDVSYNNITYLQDIGKFLPNLKELNVDNNFLSCDCEFLKTRDLILQRGVHIVRPVSCNYPKHVKGKSLFVVYCVNGNVLYDDLGLMLKDGGSGEGDLDPIYEEDRTEANEDEVDEGYMIQADLQESSSPTSEAIEGTTADPEDGSGESPLLKLDYAEYEDVEGSGVETASEDTTEFPDILPDTNVSACFFNCSTPKPVAEDEDDTELPPDLLQEIKTIYHEITGISDTTTEAQVSEVLSGGEISAKAVTEPSDKLLEAEVISKQDVVINFALPKEKEAISDAARESGDLPMGKQAEIPFDKDTQKSKQNNTTVIVVAVLLVLMVGLIVYAVIKKRARRRDNRRSSSISEEEKHTPVEMKTLLAEKPKSNDSPKTNNIPEKTPLMNGQNGTHGNKDEPEILPEIPEPVDGGINDEDLDDMDLRPKYENIPTPDTQRVTIQAKELSSPKSPVFVHRHLSDDGRIITTPSLEQRS